MILRKDKDQLKQILSKYPRKLEGFGKLKVHQIMLRIVTSIKHHDVLWWELRRFFYKS